MKTMRVITDFGEVTENPNSAAEKELLKVTFYFLQRSIYMACFEGFIASLLSLITLIISL